MSLEKTFQKFNQTQSANPALFAIQQQSFELFQQNGLPSKAEEAWHYTSLKHLSETSLEPVQDPTVVSASELRKVLAHELNTDFLNLVFVNGVIQAELSDLQQLPELKFQFDGSYLNSPVVNAIASAKKQCGDLETDSMEALNSAFSSQALVIEIAPDSVLKKPVQILYYSNTEKTEKTIYSKLFLKVGRGSKLSVIETFISQNGKSLTNAISEVLLEPSANLEYIRVQVEGLNATHVGRTRFFLEKQANLEALSYATGAALSRHNLSLYCLGEQASAKVNGLTLGFEQQHFDNHTLIDHVVGACTTEQLYKSILDGESRAVFNGRVYIRLNAQKASSQQLNNNLLLSSKAEADSKPELGIYADDVKATHGSTVGQLDPEELFYFLSRAIPKEQAIQMLSLGFVQELIDRVNTPSVRLWLKASLIKAYQKVKGHV